MAAIKNKDENIAMIAAWDAKKSKIIPKIRLKIEIGINFFCDNTSQTNPGSNNTILSAILLIVAVLLYTKINSAIIGAKFKSKK